jgi:hypothetical protein
MKLVTVVLLPGFDIRQVGEKKTTKYVFNVMETDLNGARIPAELQTFNEDIKNILLKDNHSNSEILIPFSSSNFYNFKNQYTVDSIILHPDFVISSEI